MTATFGKLENSTLTLQPGLNVISAPNEWGKSTWCAFLVTMLYGLDTRAKSTKTALADKDRYAPWSGLPMSGRMEICWQGRDITLERRAKGRTPMGDFSAYETATGLPVTELDGSNCGQTLLGVERSVFQRAGFIQLSDMPVTQDEALRRRLNALVTTGDDSGAAEELADQLKGLKNQVKYNRTGLLPQAEAQRSELERKLQEMDALQEKCRENLQKQGGLEGQIAALSNHQKALAYDQFRKAQKTIEDARENLRRTEEARQAAEEACKGLPEGAIARQRLQNAENLRQQLDAMNMEEAFLPGIPQVPEREQVPPQEAVLQAREDLQALEKLEKSKKKNSWLLGIYAGFCALLLGLLALPAVRSYALYVGAAIVLLGLATGLWCILRTKKRGAQIQVLYDRHPGLPADRWLDAAQGYAQRWQDYSRDLENARSQRSAWEERKGALASRIDPLTQGQPLEAYMRRLQEGLEAQDALVRCNWEYIQAQKHLQALESVAKEAPAPDGPDMLTWDPWETDRRLESCRVDLQNLHMDYGQYQGRMEILGNREALQRQLDAVQERVRKLEQTYRALDLALHTLSDAADELQRRFAPQITQQAQSLFGKLTGGRYDRLNLSQDLSIRAAGREETTQRTALWRSDGTADQLYLALRLAVARELTPQAPLVLDDAFARFDQERLGYALEVLTREAEQKQVILFSCQDREKRALET